MARETKRPIKTGSYRNPQAVGNWAGWIEDKDKTWILFYDAEGKALFYPKRDSNGGVLGEGLASGFTPRAPKKAISGRATAQKSTQSKKQSQRQLKKA